MVCRYCENEICVNDLCPMRADYCPVPDTDGLCRFEFREEEVFELTPKGCFTAAITDRINVDEATIDDMWSDFAELMQKFGYAENS